MVEGGLNRALKMVFDVWFDRDVGDLRCEKCGWIGTDIAGGRCPRCGSKKIYITRWLAEGVW